MWRRGTGEPASGDAFPLQLRTYTQTAYAIWLFLHHWIETVVGFGSPFVDIAALIETRRANEGQLTEDGGGYCLCCSGRTSEERREAGAGFVIRSQLVSKMASLPLGLNDRLMVMQLHLTNKQKAILISAYAPTMTNPEEVKDQLYEQIYTLIAAAPKSGKLIILGDFNARVGTVHHTWSGVIGKHDAGKRNSNGILLLRTCTAHELVITNTLFRLPTQQGDMDAFSLKALSRGDWPCIF